MRLKTGRRPQKRRKRPQKGGEQCAVPSKMAAIASSEKCEPCSTHKSELFRASLTASTFVFVIRDTLSLRLLTLPIVLNSAPGFRLRA